MFDVKEMDKMRKEKYGSFLPKKIIIVDLVGEIMAIIRPAKDTMPTSITPVFRLPARTHCVAFWFISWIEVGRRSSLISHLGLS